MSHITRPDYMRCADWELEKFINDRRLGFSEHQFRTWDLSDKARYLNVADKASCFNFLDLLPELRNIVYSELLTLRRCNIQSHGQDKCSEYCHPQVLATCKQIHHEARGVFLKENRWQLRVRTGHYTFGTEYCDDSNEGSSTVGWRKIHSSWILQACTSTTFGLPLTLTRISHLKVIVDIFRDDESQRVNTTLMIFAHLMHRRHSLQKVNLLIMLRSQTFYELAAMVRALYPLSCIRGIEQVSVEVVPDQAQSFRIGDHGLKECLEQDLWQPYTSLSPRSILLQHQRHQQLIIAAKRYRDLLRDSVKADNNEQAKMWLNGLTSAWLPAWKKYWQGAYRLFTKEEEEYFVKHVDEVELILNKVRNSKVFKQLSERALEKDLELRGDTMYDTE
ncbi:hypothetical protein K431DRAFT_295492 [Polychaeton citri CBS 116435]|uniref:Uncharacterized protein n=1 Tax=Polychaeton citri CBS 116435 TaxID=1314669 RepID=A0A9P4Q8G8_9PEZI|nr:hypothetical protein K431DRAFT_295492 [Polychaeton citri CBS 116435]